MSALRLLVSCCNADKIVLFLVSYSVSGIEKKQHSEDLAVGIRWANWP